MSEWLHPSWLLFAGALPLLLLGDRLRRAWQLLIPALALAAVLGLEPGTYGSVSFLGFDLTLMRIDPLSLVFAYVFATILVIGSIYALHVNDGVQHIAAFTYAGAAQGVILAGDLITLYVFWELMALTSVWLIWRRQTATAYAAGFRYILVHAAGGMVLLVGILAYYHATGSVAFGELATHGAGFYLILLGFLINAAAPPLHAWLPDAYPEATVTGIIFLSALTTKTAVYALMRGFPGTELLVWLGAFMTLYGVTFAALVNDIRRLLSYHIVSQVGYMVAGVGLGTSLALNGTAAHAFTHILYKALLLMGAGAVLHMAGRSKMSELGGLYRTMPWTLVLYMVGALSISAFPLFSGFVSKTMIVKAAAEDYRAVIWLMLTAAGVGTFLSVGLKLPYFTFFGRDSGLRPAEAPPNMLVAMAIAGALCLFIGVAPAPLYAILPYGADYNAYTFGHLLKEMQLLTFTGLGFYLLLNQLRAKAKISLDTDWVYRRLAPTLIARLSEPIATADRAARAACLAAPQHAMSLIRRGDRSGARLARSWPVGSMALWTAVVLAVLILSGLR